MLDRTRSLFWALALCLASPCWGQSFDALIRDSFTGATGDGSLASTQGTIEAYLAGSPGDNDAQAALGVVRFLRSGEMLVQRVRRHGGFNLAAQGVMLTGIASGAHVVINPNPDPLTYAEFRGAIEAWVASVAEAEAALAAVGDEEVKVRLPIGLVRMDINGDGRWEEREQLWQFFRAVQRRFRPTQADADAFEIAFDRGDVAWLRGYCNVCMAIGEFMLAHDMEDAFERAGHVLFANNVTEHEYLKGSRHAFDVQGVDIADVVALIHLMSFDVVEPARMERARLHLLETVRLADEMWRWYDAETDDDREWIPNPNQRDPAMPGAFVNADMRDVWMRLTEEGGDLLRGDRLLRFWRGDGSEGINVRRFFQEPRRFDLVLWVQGSGAAPYLEEGRHTSDGLWRDLQETFGQQVFRYMWWFN